MYGGEERSVYRVLVGKPEGKVIIRIIIFMNCNGLSPGGSGYFTCIQNMKLITNKFKSEGLH